MREIPHPDRATMTVSCAVITVSDTRLPATDKSGQLIQELLIAAGHTIGFYTIVKDEPEEIKLQVRSLCQLPDLNVMIFNGGTGIAPRDTTYDAIEGLLEKSLPGFGELFRWLSYQEIGSRAMGSRATAGVCQGKLIFSLPGSSNAVKLAVEKLILPELVHLVNLLQDVEDSSPKLNRSDTI
ncbi:molybdenum cofactor biosynthesis protein [Oscillatoriales cyanobacterium USR001]|nr:molybdenum cofactor biosynthesis protein [Oscillatoriales cyanobacterium USR001]